jgi:hypothetical protein
MSFLGIVLGMVVLIIVVVIWLKYYKQIKADAGETLLGSPIRMRKGDPASLEEFVAAYRRGEVAPPSGITPAPTAPKIPVPSVSPPAPASTAQAPMANTPLQVRNPFLSAEVRLAYLLCRTGLRDHHVFPNLPLATLCVQGSIDASLSRASVDLLICNPQMAPIAAIDMVGAQTPAPESAKVELLKSLGLRYLRLSAKSLPKPEAMHALLYKM